MWLRRLDKLLLVEAEGGKLPGMHGQSRSRRLWEASEAARRALLRCEGGAGPIGVVHPSAPAKAGDEPDLIFKR